MDKLTFFFERKHSKNFLKKRCGVRDTAAVVVPATFLILFSSPEKRRYFIQPRTKDPIIRKQAFIFSLTSKGVAGATQQNFAPTLKRCGVRDTVAVVVTGDFFASFSALEKEVTKLYH